MITYRRLKLIAIVGVGMMIVGCATQSNSIDRLTSGSLNYMISEASNLSQANKAPKQILNSFMEALLIADPDASALAVAPFVHKSLKTRDGKLDSDTRYFSFKKAHENARFYQYHVKVSRAKKLKTTGIGAAANGTAELGVEVDYWLAKKRGAGGRDAAITVFFPKNGGSPTISYMGSL